jgi:competence/damage-inducible protein CinA-like protein
MKKIAMLSTGEEVLYGDIVDTNAAWVSRLFFENGLAMYKRSTVGDQRSALTQELVMLSLNMDVVIVNGGLGPTSDDLTAEVASVASEQPLVLHQAWLERLKEFYAKRGKNMPESNIKQAMLPDGSTVIDNPIGTACGFKMKINDCLFYFTPGVPSEFKKMIEEQILPDLKAQFPMLQGRSCSRLYTFGLSESGIADTLKEMHLPEGFELGYRSYLPFIEVKLFGPSADLERRNRVLSLVERLLHSNVVSIDEPLLARLGHLLETNQQSLAVAELATQGQLTAWLQEEGRIAQHCSASWVLGKMTVSPLDKEDLLGATFALAGATKTNCNSDLSLVTGRLVDNRFAIALATPKGEWGQVLSFQRQYNALDQKVVIRTVAADMLRRFLEGKPLFADYGFLTREKDMFLPPEALNH